MGGDRDGVAGVVVEEGSSVYQSSGRHRARGSARAPTAAAGDDQEIGRVLAEGSRRGAIRRDHPGHADRRGRPDQPGHRGPGHLDKIAFYGAGWQIHAENLAAHIAGRDRGDTEARWDELIPPYQDLAANIG